MKIYICEVEAWERDRFRELDDEHQVAFCEVKLTPENAGAYEDAEVLCPFIHSAITAELLEGMPRLKLVATRSTGTDHIDLEYCRGRGITVCNVPAYGDNTVAEHVFGLLLTISHRLYDAVDRTRKGDFSQQGLQGFDLRGKTMGVVGTGTIGRHVIRIARGFGMQVLAYDVQPREERAGELGFRYVPLEELLAGSDVVTLHVPSNPSTRHLLSGREFSMMKKGAVLINTSRGSVVDIQALIGALASRTVSAAGLDVLPEEPVIREEAELLYSAFRRKHNLETLLADHILLRLRNVYVTPHSAFNTREAVERIQQTTIENIRAFAAARPRNVVVTG
ncbi:MAG: hydroxyacid dehydrogenase [Spirochaetota bacterium]